MKVLETTKHRLLSRPVMIGTGVAGFVVAAFLTAASAQEKAVTQPLSNAAIQLALKDGPPLEFRGTISGDVLETKPMEDETFTPEAKHFLATGENPYRSDPEAVKKGYTIFSTACSGCHGHLAEGKLGPALADAYWTYPKNETDKGIFETIYGGAAGMMGPQQGRLTVDEILHVIAWIRHQAEENEKNGGSATPHG